MVEVEEEKGKGASKPAAKKATATKKVAPKTNSREVLRLAEGS